MKTIRFSFIALLCLMAIEVFAQECTITGQIFDAETKESIPGVPVIIKGTTKGVTSDLDGLFTIKTKIGAQLYIKYLSYDEQEITVTEKLVSLCNNKKTKNGFTILLKTNTTAIDDVVVTSYYKQPKGTSTEAVEVIGEKALRSSTSNNIDQTLQGHAGMVVTTSGSPGASSQVMLRGPGTINNSDPLYILDGIPQSASPRVNASDVKSVTILKDASACALYGSRGANGVIVITTKGGVIKKQAEEKTYHFRNKKTYKGTLFVVDSLIIDTIFDFKSWGFKKRQVNQFYLEKQKNRMAYVFMDTKPEINENLKNISTNIKEWVLKHPHCTFSINDTIQPSKAIVLKTLNTKTIVKLKPIETTDAELKYGVAGKMGVLEILLE
jgi:TonB-dependent SusC/RagA subfamily outer membrane receptor